MSTVPVPTAAPAAPARKRKSHSAAAATPAEIIAIDCSDDEQEEQKSAAAAPHNTLMHQAALERATRQQATADAAPAAASTSSSRAPIAAAALASAAAAAASFSVAASSFSAAPAAAAAAALAPAPARRPRASAAAPASLLASAPDTSLLPHTYQFLLELFPKVYTHAALIWSAPAAAMEAPNQSELASGAPACTFDSMRSNPDIGARFSFQHLRQMVTLAPSMLTLRPLILPKPGQPDPFAPANIVDVRRLPLQGQYELLSTPLLARAAANHAKREASASSEQSARYTGGDRNSVSRPRGPKPTPQRLAQAVVEFKQCVVSYFAHPDASMNIPPCALPPHDDPAAAAGDANGDAAPSQAQLSVPRYSKLLDRFTVSIADNNDPATRPRCAESYQPLSAPPAGLAALLGLPAVAVAAPADDSKMEDAEPDSRVKQEPASAGVAAAASSSSAAAAAAPAPAAPAAPAAPIKLDPALLSSISSPLFHNLLFHLRQQKFYQAQIEFVKHIPARAAITVEIKPRPFAVGGAAPAAAPAAAAAALSAAPAAAAAASAAPVVDRAAALLGLAPSDDSPVLLSPRIVRALSCLSPPIRSLFLHQAQAITALHEGTPVVVVATATSSGKSLCYSLPILETLTAEPQARALCLFPTKALAQDQLRSLREFIHAVGGAGLGVDTYDGDTAQALRASVRNSSRVLLTNPDMLHLSMLPLHTTFADLWRNLKFIVLDESHVYHSQFGAHVALVLRRLRRVCAFYGSRPQFVCTSATMSAPTEMISALLGMPAEEIRVVTEDGSARGEKNFIVWNPPKAEMKPADAAAAAAGSAAHAGHDARAFEFAPFLSKGPQRRSAHMESALLLANLVQINYKTICFTGSRKVAEIISKWTCETLSQTRSTRELIPLVRSYRGGYSAADRRAIESALFSDQLRGVVSTNALELGIDIGTLDATVHVGVPKSVSSLWQQSGRSGRGVRDSLSILVAFDSPLDQYYCAHPHELFERKVEKCVIDVENPELLRAHVMCAAVELPLTASRDLPYFGAAFLPIFHTLIHDKFWLAQRARDPRIASPFDAWAPCYELVNGTWEREFGAQQAALAGCKSTTSAPARGCNSDVGPAAYFSLRSPSGLVFSIQDSQSGRELDTTEHRRAMFDLHVGAVFNHQGAEYLVQSWNHSTAVIKVKALSKAGAEFFTRCIDHKWITIMSRILTFPAPENDAARASAQPVEETMPTSLARHLQGLCDSVSSSNATAVCRTFDPEWSVLPRDAGIDGGSWYLKAESDLPSSSPLTWRKLCAYGRAKISTSVYGFRRFSKRTGKVMDKEDLSMPLHQFDTWAAWVDIPASIRHAYAQWEEAQFRTQRPAQGQCEDEEERKTSDLVQAPAGKRVKRESQAAASLASAAAASAASSSSAAAAVAVSASPVSWSPDGLLSVSDRNRMQEHAIHAALHGLCHCIIALLPMFLLCDGPTDMRCDCPSVYEMSYEERESRPHRLLLYESQSAVGPAFVRATSQVMHLVLQRARMLIESCPCTGLRGCPSCVQSSRCSELNEVTYKAGALWLAKALEQWSQEEAMPQ